MNAATVESRPPAGMETRRRGEGPWARSRLWVAIALIFVMHIGLIFALGDRKPITPRQPAFAPELRLAGNSGELLTLNDPTLFALPHASGFSGAAWMKTPRVQPESFQWSESPRWLPLPVEQLGAEFSHFMQTNTFARFSPELKATPQLTLPESTEIDETPNAKSILRVEGDLASRTLLNPPSLSPSPGNDLIANSIVQVLVDEGGNVISAVLLPSGSGSKEADQNALNLAKSARFAPLPRKTVDAKRAASRWTRGRMVFQWFTVPLSQTNAPLANP